MQTATLTRAEIEAHDPEGGRGGRWLCPMPECGEHTDPRRHRSLSLVPETGLWHCHRCHAQGQIKDAWKPFEKKSRQERNADAMTRRRVGLEKILAKVSQPEQTAPAPDASDKWRYGSLVKLETSPAAVAYLAPRGLSSPEALALLTRSGVRFASDFGRREAIDTVKASQGTASIVFPLRDAHGKLIASQGRFLKPWGSGQKFHTLGDKLAGVFATVGAMEILLKGGPVAIVEAPFDACTLALAGVPALALCGCNGIPEWLQRKAFGRKWAIAFDADHAGDASAETIGEALRSLGGIVERLRPTEAKDWNEALQIGGEVWERTAEALLSYQGSEAEATPSQEPAELGEARKGPKEPDAEGQKRSEKVGFEGQEKARKGVMQEAGKEPQKASKSHLENEEILPPPLAEASELRQVDALYSDCRQQVLTWALVEARRGTLPEPSDTIVLPSGQRIAPGGASVWLQEAQKRAEALSLASSVSVDAEKAFLVVRQDMRLLALWAADARVWLDSPATHRGAFRLLPWAEVRLDAELKALASEFEDDLPELDQEQSK